MGSSFDTLLKNDQTLTPSAAPEPAALPKPTSSFDTALAAPKQAKQTSSFDSILAPATAPVTTSEEVPKISSFDSLQTPTTPAKTSSFDELFNNQDVRSKAPEHALTNEELAYGKKSPDEMEDAPWYEKAWEWANSPLWDLHQYGTRTGAGNFERGLETGLEDIASGFTSPLMIGLTIATFGGSAVETAGLGALRGIGVAADAAPIVLKTGKALMTAGFSAQMIGGLVTQSPQFLDALKEGDTENATRLGTNLLATGFFLKEGLKHGFEDATAIKNFVKGKNLTTTDQLALVQELSGNYELAKQKGSDFARAHQEDIVAQLKAAGAFGDDVTEAGMRHYITQGGDLSRIEKMYGIAEGTIKPREWTIEELKQQDAAAEIRDWTRDSHAVTKNPDGTPKIFYITDGEKGTLKLGQALADKPGEAGGEEDASYVKMKNPIVMRDENNLKQYIKDAGSEEGAREKLLEAGYDGIVAGTGADRKIVALDNDQIRSAAEAKEAVKTAWSRDHVYIAVDKKNADIISNQGIGKDPGKINVQYHPTPELALENATLPDSGKKSDLIVLSVPRAEVEQGVYETNARVHGKLSDRAQIGPVEVLPRAQRDVRDIFDQPYQKPGPKAQAALDKIESYAKDARDVKDQFGLEHLPSVTSERQTGTPAEHAMIKEGGGIPAGEWFGIRNFHDPATHTTIGFGPGEVVSKEAVEAKLLESRKAFTKTEADRTRLGINPDGTLTPEAQARVDAKLKAEPTPGAAKREYVAFDRKTGIPFKLGDNPNPVKGSALYEIGDNGTFEHIHGQETDVSQTAAAKYANTLFSNRFTDPNVKFEPHVAIPDKLKAEAGIGSDSEIHFHELAHSIWSGLFGKLPIGDIYSHLSSDAERDNYVAAAEIGIEKFLRKGQWDPSKFTEESVGDLINTYMAGTAADEHLSKIPRHKNAGNRSDIDLSKQVLRAAGITDERTQWKIINNSVDQSIERLKKYKIGDILKEEFEKGREPGVPDSIHYSRERLLHIIGRIKEQINEVDNEAKGTDEVHRGSDRQDAGQAEGRPEGGTTQTLRREGKRPEVADDLLITEKRHMPGHLLEMDSEGKPTGRSIPLRPLGAEDLPGNASRFHAKYTEAEKAKYLAGLKAAQNLTPQQIEICKTIRSMYDASFDRAYEKGMIRDWVEAYHPQAWANEPNGMWKWLFRKDNEPVTNGALNELRHQTNDGSFDTNINAARHRAYNTEFQGVMAGEKFKSDDLSMHLFNHLKAVEHAIAAREFLSDLRKKDSRATDGRPAVIMQGTARKVGGEQNPAMIITPDGVHSIRIAPEKIEDMRITKPGKNISELEDALNKGTIIKLPWTTVDEEGQKVPAYAYSAEGYVSIDHPSTRAWNYAGQDTAGNPALMHARMMVHPDFEQHVRRTLGAEQSIVRDSKILRGVNVAAGEAKGLLLSFSPFHIVQEGLRALMVGVNPFDVSHIDSNTNPNLQRGFKNGLKTSDYHAEDQYSTGYASHSRLISKIPGVNRIQGAMQSFLFEKYIPGLKERAYLKIYEDVLKQNEHLTPDEAASRAADMVNDTFGGQNWKKLGVSTSQQDFARMFALAPDWLVSEIRMGMRAMGMMDKETGAISRRMMMIQMASMWGAMRVINMLSSGQMHNEAPFGVVRKDDKGQEVVYSVRTLPTDLIHAATDPRGFIAGRVNPLTVRPTMEFLSGRDALGRRAPMEQQVVDFGRNILPIAGQGLLKGGDINKLDQFYKGVGGSVYKYRTEAEKMANQYASDRMPSGPVDKDRLEAHQKELRVEDALRSGEITKAQVKQLLPERRATEVLRRKDMTPLQARFDRLPMSEAINIWNAATNSEKDLLADQLSKKKRAWLKQHKPNERALEPVWRKMQHTWGDLR